MSQSVSLKANDGFYINGKAFDICKKKYIKRDYKQMMDENNGIRPNISQVARKSKVPRSIVFKIEEEILTENRIVSPE